MTHDEIIAAIVKPLVWRGADHFFFGSGVGFSYEIMRHDDMFHTLVLTDLYSNTIGQPIADLAAAKAAAEADYRARKAADLYVGKIAALVKAATSANDEIGRMKPTETLVAVALPLRAALAAFKVTPWPALS